MPSISLCMITRDEEETLARCLNCVQGIADEIIIVDTGSTDRTKDIAKEYTDKIYDFEWADDFSAARNFSFAQATMEYILWLDADDVIPDADRSKYIKLKKDLDPELDVVMMRYITGTNEEGQPDFYYYRERLLKKSCGFLWKEPVHEYLDFGGNVLTSDISIVHKKIHKTDDARNLAIYESMAAKGQELSPRGLYYYARELMEHEKISEAIKQFNLFMESGEGWTEDCIDACYELASCYGILNHTDEALQSLFKSFLYDSPRVEACCRIGFILINRQSYKNAIFWFDLATKLPPNTGWGFMHPDYSDYVPYMELAVCYDRLGDYATAEAYNNRAGSLKPDSPEFLYNKKYFTALKKTEKEPGKLH